MSGTAPRKSEIFARVLESEPQVRPAVLARLCGGDTELARQIEELVATAERAMSTDAMRRGLELDVQTLAPGTEVGPYVIEREIERGGMGIIYLAHDTTLHRRAILKTSRFSRDPRFRGRLEQEARLAARLSGHPGIAVIYGLVQQGDDLYIAQEFVDGITLRQALARGPLPPNEALDAAIAIAGAMHAAHEAGIVHRDLKPENIMRMPNGTYKVLDFGIAKMDAAALETSLNPGLTLPGEALGTPGYASPEQLLGRPVDRRSDIFSFGIVLYEMLTGRHPFGESTQYAAALDDPAPLDAAATASLPPGVAAIIDRCLQKAPAGRYPSAAELERDLRAVRGGTAVQPITPSTRSRAIRWWQFHLFAATLANALLIWALWHVRGWWPRWKLVEGLPDLAISLLFFAPLALVCVIGVLRFNLAFTIDQHPSRTERQYHRVQPWLRVLDSAFAGLVGLAGVLIAADHPNWATLLIACAVSIAAVAFVIEPNTADEAIAAVRPTAIARN
ncbi:MAG TPA: serine/threonine-protein kinase [Vicinamibacterales bacterium]|nr:serine/threonine-protein kinase [Vicinamibacterales bacterium]